MSIDIVKQIPAMAPWIGANYSKSNEKLLILGESHYLPEDSTVHLNPDIWYNITEEDLSEEELEWISTRDIISYAIENNFNIKSHGIYRNIAQALNVIAGKPDYSDTLNDICFSNYFKRPAICGESLEVTKMDEDAAALSIKNIIKENKPDIIVFTSSLAGKYGEEVVDPTDIPYYTVPHPTCQWWNRKSKKYGDNTGRELLIEFLTECGWC